ncbi:uncharacterized protein PFL1_04809 [Pseudozyma flocculosa PF-1]|uniref:XPG N-terminal domain-containing protein n=2 Tax=Pseudozyma flocculosa TaxID=84751 RepID=A0A5C3F5F1_9BASI|nr:uncharacterized protein PFL1_04809 [Pseudozyma flocculosa PF-1]EPQ27671.1 hypothetical protein PFL1_04809 [Pseudozyma flocculosa PF-1]SPO39196.1 uncharacterized protein PSFLO_04675 [Pseudozyma flocculosa]
MRPSATRRGVKGLFPLIRSLAPSSISAPFPLSSLHGLRLAIDATLLIQKLHFADDPHPSRHLIGFYRLLNSLRENGVAPLMVFDHPSKRLALKDREQDKRKRKRELDRMRNRMEAERKVRLRSLQAVLDTLRRTGPEERSQVGALLDTWHKQRASERAAAEPLPEPDVELADKLAAEYLATRDVPDWDARRSELWQHARKAVLAPLAGSAASKSQQQAQIDTAATTTPTTVEDPDSLQADNLDLLEQLGQRASLGDVPGPAAAEASADDLYDLAGDENLVSLEREPYSALEAPAHRPQEGEWEQVLEDLTSRPFALALRVDRSQRQFEDALAQMGEFQSRGQRELTEIEQKLYDQIVASLKPPSTPPAPLSSSSTPLGTSTTAAAAASPASRTPPLSDQAISEVAAEASAASDAAQDLASGAAEATAASTATATAAADATADTAAAVPAAGEDRSRPQEALPSSVSPLTTLNRGLSKTYARSTMPLSPSIYSDCAHLCSLMAVPVFWTGDGTRSGGGRIHEAEAYASSLVKAGYADIVASEDSDVLLYDTPLLRGLVGGIRLSHPVPGGASGKRLMEVVDGTMVRRGLFDFDTLQSFFRRKQLEAAEQHGSEGSAASSGGRRKGVRKPRSRSKTLLLSPAATRASTKGVGVARDDAAAAIEPASDSVTGSPSADGQDIAAAPVATLKREEYDKMTRSMMLDFALLCGTDFNRTVPGIGPKTALKLILQHGSISNVLERESKKFRPPDGLSIKEYEAELRNARTVFTNPPKVRAAARSVFAALNSATKSQGGAGRIDASAAPSTASDSDRDRSLPWTQRFFEIDAVTAADDGSASPASVEADKGDLATLADVVEPAAAGQAEEGGVERTSDAPQDHAVAAGDGAQDGDATEAAGSSFSSDTAGPTYDRDAVLDFLREKGVFGGARPVTWHSRDDDSWRDIMDLELGITPQKARPGGDGDGSDASGVEWDVEDQWQASESSGETVTGADKRLMGVDFFGEREAGTACWSPDMEHNVRRSTTVAADAAAAAA